MAWFEPFRESVVMVTGASSGIGRATALAFAHAGARVAVVARRRALLEELAREAGSETLVVPTDVTRRDEVAACFSAVRDRFGRVDVVVNGAGILIPGKVEETPAEDLEAMLRVNLVGAMLVVQQALATMRPQGDGVIVNLASLAGRRGVSPLGGYCATKFALIGMTEALRDEIAGSGVHVGLVLPGIVDTPMVSSVSHDEEFLDFWPRELNMPPSWVVWAIFAVARFRLVEVSVPPGAATLEKLASLAPGVADTLVAWAQRGSRWLSRRLHGPKA